jgi:hypothetical protein
LRPGADGKNGHAQRDASEKAPNLDHALRLRAPAQAVKAINPKKTLALAGLEAAIRLIDDVKPSPAAHDAVVAVPDAQSSKRILDLHGQTSMRGLREAREAPRHICAGP